MSMGIIESGEYNKVAGLGGGAGAIRKGISATSTIAVGGFTATSSVVFDTPMPDADYVAVINPIGNGAYWSDYLWCVKNQTKNGFEIQFNTIHNDPTSKAFHQ